jgi:hypothetical protein
VLDMKPQFHYNNTMRIYKKRPWSHEERTLLTQKYYFCKEKELAELFPDRSYNSCVKQAKYLRERGWVFKKP